MSAWLVVLLLWLVGSPAASLLVALALSRRRPQVVELARVVPPRASTNRPRARGSAACALAGHAAGGSHRRPAGHGPRGV